MSDLTRETLAELRRLAATAADATTERTPWYSADDLLTYGVESEDDAPYFAALTPPIVLALLDAATERDALAAKLDAVRALHYRRPHDVLRDAVAFGQIEFRDQCDHCRRAYPCPTIRILDGEADRG